MTDTTSSIPWKTGWVLKLLVHFLERIAPQSLRRLKATLSSRRKALHTDHSMIASTAEGVRWIIISVVLAAITAIAVSVVNVPLFVNDMKRRYVLFSPNHLMFAMAAHSNTTALWKNICTMLIKPIWSTWSYAASPDQDLILRKMNSDNWIPWSALY